MFNYLFLYTGFKLTFDFLINNYYLFNEHIYQSYAEKLIRKTFKNDNNIVNYVNKKTTSFSDRELSYNILLALLNSVSKLSITLF